MTQKACLVDDCEKVVHRRGLCSAHYQLHRRHGDLDAVALPPYSDGCKRVLPAFPVYAAHDYCGTCGLSLYPWPGCTDPWHDDLPDPKEPT